MALKEMMKICGEVRKQWAVTKVVILHRIVRYYNMYFFVFCFSFGVGEMGDVMATRGHCCLRRP